MMKNEIIFLYSWCFDIKFIDMIESLVTVSLIGLLSGFILSMPIAGPISIIITSNALKGNKKFALRTALGTALSEFLYVFAAIFGITYLYSTYQPAVPYILMVGAIFLFLVGIKIFRSKLGIENLDDSEVKKPKVKGGLRTGIAINLMNPSLFVNWLVASFMIFSFASSIGLNVGELNLIVADNIKEIKTHSGEAFEDLEIPSDLENQTRDENRDGASSISLAILYAGCVGLGTYSWLYILIAFISKYKNKLDLRIINFLVRALAVLLICMSSFLFYQAIIMIT